MIKSIIIKLLIFLLSLKLKFNTLRPVSKSKIEHCAFEYAVINCCGSVDTISIERGISISPESICGGTNVFTRLCIPSATSVSHKRIVPSADAEIRRFVDE